MYAVSLDENQNEQHPSEELTWQIKMNTANRVHKTGAKIIQSWKIGKCNHTLLDVNGATIHRWYGCKRAKTSVN